MGTRALPVGRLTGSAAVMLLQCLQASMVQAADVRAATRLFRPGSTAVTTAQAGELTLTLTDVVTRPIQTWVRVAGTLDPEGKVVSTFLRSPDAGLIAVGQRVRSFSVGSRTQMHQAKISRVSRQDGGARVEATLSDLARVDGSTYLMEIVVERGRYLSVPNVSIIEEGAVSVVYLQKAPGQYVPRIVHTGLQGELYTQILDGLAEGDQVVSIGSFFVDADSKLKSGGME
jgi:hypothetical protein